MAWLLLLLAGLLEVAFAASLKPAEGFTRLWPSMGVIVFGSAAVFMLTRALDAIPVSTAYAVFTAIGAVGTVVVAALLYDESLGATRLVCIALILLGVVGLRMQSP